MTFDLKKYLEETGKKIDQALTQYLPAKNGYPPKLMESMHYSHFAGGKRLRPVLCVAGAEACGGKAETVLSIATALEMIHTFSLIHDDLPAMDDDNLRRGHPTNHKVFGEGMAILAGDGLFAWAFTVMTREFKHPKADRVLDIIGDIATATGPLGMVGGQAVDLMLEGTKPGLEELARLHSLKTGRLITVSVVSGAKAVCEDSEKIKALTIYGDAIGLAFQIADDILDIEGGEEIGKDVGSDVENGKATYPALLGLDGAKKEARMLIEKALAALAPFDEQADPLRALAHYIVERKK